MAERRPRKKPTKTLRPPPRKLRLRVSPHLTEQETRRLKARAKANLRSIADYVSRLIEVDLRKRSSRTTGRAVRGAGPNDRRAAYEIGMMLTVEQRQRIEAKAEHEGRSLSSYVTRVIVEGARG